MIRSFLFAPGNRRELILKFPRVPADCFVIDLEDGTPPRAKDEARRQLPDIVGELRKQTLSGLLYVRVNEVITPHLEEDLKAIAKCDLDGIVVPKLEHASDIQTVLSGLKAVSLAKPLGIIAGIESMTGVLGAPELAASHPQLVALYFGSEDYAADFGVERTVQGDEIAYARSKIVLAARAMHKFAIDQAVPQIKDADRFKQDAMKGKGLGYTGKICLTPQQVEICNTVFTPTDAEIAESNRLMEAYEAGEKAGNEMIIFEGKVIIPEGPLVKRARRILHIAKALGEKRA